jgi:hypothetical protein
VDAYVKAIETLEVLARRENWSNDYESIYRNPIEASGRDLSAPVESPRRSHVIGLKTGGWQS